MDRARVRSRLRWILDRTFDEIRYTLLLTALNSLCGAAIVPPRLRPSVYRLLGLDMRASRVYPGCYFTGPEVSIEAGAMVNARCFFETTAPITIGERTQIGMEVMLCTATHEASAEARRSGAVIGAPIQVGAGCWIGTRAVILPGVTIGAGTVIAAGAVVREDCEANAMYAGVPARLIRRLDDKTAPRATGV